MYCIWEAREGLTAEDMQTFIDSPDGPGSACMNNTVMCPPPPPSSPSTASALSSDASARPPAIPALRAHALRFVHKVDCRRVQA